MIESIHSRVAGCLSGRTPSVLSGQALWDKPLSLSAGSDNAHISLIYYADRSLERIKKTLRYRGPNANPHNSFYDFIPKDNFNKSMILIFEKATLIP